MSRLSIAVLFAATALVPASHAQTQDRAAGVSGAEPCAELLAHVRDNDTRATGMTSRRASKVAETRNAQACTDALRVARGEISVDKGASNYDAAAAERLEQVAPQDEVAAPGQPADQEEAAPGSVATAERPKGDAPVGASEQERAAAGQQPSGQQPAADEGTSSGERSDDAAAGAGGQQFSERQAAADEGTAPDRQPSEAEAAAGGQDQASQSLAEGSAGLESDQQGQARQTTSALSGQEPFHPDESRDAEATTGPGAHREEVERRARPPQVSGEESAAGPPGPEPQPLSPTTDRAAGAQQAEAPGDRQQGAEQQAEAPADEGADETRQAEAPASEEATGDAPQVRAPARRGGSRQDTVVGRPPSSLNGPPNEQVAIQAILASSVYGADGEEVGDVEDFVALEDQPYVIVGAGGFLGLGEKTIALPLDGLVMRGEDELYARDVTAAEIEEMEEADLARFRPLNPNGQIEVATQ